VAWTSTPARNENLRGAPLRTGREKSFRIELFCAIIAYREFSIPPETAWADRRGQKKFGETAHHPCAVFAHLAQTRPCSRRAIRRHDAEPEWIGRSASGLQVVELRQATLGRRRACPRAQPLTVMR